jgi:hypothetical protein
MGTELNIHIREEHRLRVIKNRVLRETDQNTGEKVTGEWRQLHIEELHNLDCSPSIIGGIITRMRWAEYVARTWIKQIAYRIFVRRT